MAFNISGFTKSFDPGTDLIGGVFGGKAAGAHNLLTDPLDLFGRRAEATADEVRQINEAAAREAITAQRGQIGRVTDLFDPFVSAAQTPLQELQAAITGEGFDFTPGEQYTTGLDRGTRAIRRAAAARGSLDSSATEARLADLANALTAQETQRQIENRLQPIRVGQQASGVIGQQEAAGAGAGSSVFSNLAGQNLLAAQNLGQARQSAFSSAAGGLQGLSQLLAQQGA